MPLPSSTENATVTDAGVETIGRSIPWLRNELRSRCVRLDPRCTLARYMDQTEKFARRVSDDPSLRYPSATAAQQEYLYVSGTDYLSKALHRGASLGVSVTDQQLRCFGSGNPVLTERSSQQSKDRDTAWEVLLAHLLAPIATAIELDREPDILCFFHDRRVGIAAKVCYSLREDELRKDIRKGAEQLEASGADHGFVAVNLVERFPHAETMELMARAKICSVDALLHHVGVWVSTFVQRLELDRLAESLRDCSKVSSLLLLVPTVLPVNGQPVPYYRLHTVSMAGREERAGAFEHALNSSVESVLSWRPDDAG